ncbi:MAG: hypothetical protein ABEI74_04820 [Candidatus Pacearchaeota archaeon]
MASELVVLSGMNIGFAAGVLTGSVIFLAFLIIVLLINKKEE